MSTVVIARGNNLFSPSFEMNDKSLAQMYTQGLFTLTGQSKWKDCLHSFLPTKEKVGIKINTIGGKSISTRPNVALCLAQFLSDNHDQNGDVVVWDRTNRELQDAGYKLNWNRRGIKVFGTDTQGIGYNQNLISHLNIGSLFSRIQSNHISSSISLAILKDHGLAGVTAGMKNYFGAIHNPNKYHDTNCDPYVAEVFASSLIKKKHRLTILDGLIVQYHRGPSYHSRWAEKQGMLIFSFDPVAADTIGWQIIEKLRAKKGLPSLSEEDREPRYLKSAEKMGLGTANFDKIKIKEVVV
ncbi:MAG: DUF362 domain-containing protein [Candidatus Aminicenantes bacterium]|nr:MAG: DUF362 domain-containing protein [Candidatus Aminicenantes bacterium]